MFLCHEGNEDEKYDLYDTEAEKYQLEILFIAPSRYFLHPSSSGLNWYDISTNYSTSID